MARYTPYENYLNTDAATTDQLGLIILMYDASIRYLREAKGGFERQDRQAFMSGLEKARATISELRNTLDMTKGGEVAAGLIKLYNFCTREILLANAEFDTKRVDDVMKVLINLREGWQQISKTDVRKGEFAVSG